MRVEPLIGNYCPDCAQTLSTGNWKAGSLVPLCHKCLDELISKGDLDRAQEYVHSEYESQIKILESENVSLRAKLEKLTVALEYIFEHSVEPFIDEKWTNEINYVAKEALSEAGK